MKTPVQLMVDQQRLQRENIALLWLLRFSHDTELTGILTSADTENLCCFIVWALERGLILDPNFIDCDGDPIPF